MRDQREIYRVENLSDYSDCDGNAVPYLTYIKPDKKNGDKLLSIGGTDATLEGLAILCDHDAEDCNAHEFCGAHRLLGAVLYRKCGRRIATAVMLDIAKRGGLHTMNGLRGPMGGAYKDLGVGKCGCDWNGSYGE